MMIVLIIGGLLIVFGIAGAPARGRPITKRRKGIEMMAENGRLIHVRETESEHEL